jgi:hypothetical protein
MYPLTGGGRFNNILFSSIFERVVKSTGLGGDHAPYKGRLIGLNSLATRFWEVGNFSTIKFEITPYYVNNFLATLPRGDAMLT